MISAVCIAVLSALYLNEARKIPFGSFGMPGAGFVPVLIGIALFTLCALLVVKEILFQRQAARNPAVDLWEEGGESSGGSMKKPLLLGGSFLFYAFFFSSIGFVVSTVALLWVCFMVFEFRGLAGSLIASLILTAVGYIVFSMWLDVQFPHGLLY